jgi:hypothetical protein
MCALTQLAVTNSNVKIIKLLLENSFPYDSDCLCYLTRNNKYDILKILLQNLNNCSDGRDIGSKLKVFFVAASDPNVKALKLFIENNFFSPDEAYAGEGLLSIACVVSSANSCVNVLKLLLDSGWDLNFVGQMGFNALHSAIAQRGPLGAVALLLERGADIEGPSENDSGSRPLHIGIGTYIFNKYFICFIFP